MKKLIFLQDVEKIQLFADAKYKGNFTKAVNFLIRESLSKKNLREFKKIKEAI